ncbi:cupin [Streptomyces sp. NPDC086554]|uniref:cupin n=1 Tax=Streptomyces sp. NPDC086554 TaxID=3154864 RepID=UPI0034470331
MTTTYDLQVLADEHLALAQKSAHGRSAHLLLREDPLRQSVIALTAGNALDEHYTPVAATLQVLRGTVRLTAASGDVTLVAGQLHPIGPERHGLTAVTDAAVLLTAVTA